MLRVNKLSVFYHQQEIVKQVSLTIKPKEIVLLMGPNGSGKSTLVNALLGHPDYQIKTGTVTLDKKKLNNLNPEQRVKQGLFLGWQNPISVPGVSLTKLLGELGLFSHNSSELLKQLHQYAQKLAFSDSLLLRGLNDGFSGGERKKIEMLQAILLAKKYVLFDEIDTGLDLDALKQIAEAINQMKKQSLGCLVVTHYPGLFKLLDFERVLVMKKGKIVKSGTQALAEQIKKHGYANL